MKPLHHREKHFIVQIKSCKVLTGWIKAVQMFYRIELFILFFKRLESVLGCFDYSCRKTNALPWTWTLSNTTSPELFETVQPQPSGEIQQITTDLINSSCINLNRRKGEKKNHGIVEENRAVSWTLQACKQFSPQDVRRHMESSCEQLEQPPLAQTFIGDFFFLSRPNLR